MSDVITGAKALFAINGIIIAYASSCSYNWNHAHEPIQVLDELPVAEHAETGMTVDFSCSMFRVARKSTVSLGIQPKLERLLQQPELVVTIKDRVTGDTLLNVEGVKLTGRSGAFDARGAWAETLSFVGRKMTDEEGP
jgi:hypothetical protein